MAARKPPAQTNVFKTLKRTTAVRESTAEVPDPAPVVETVANPLIIPEATALAAPKAEPEAAAPTSTSSQDAEVKAPLTIFFPLSVRTKFRAKAKRLKITKPVALMVAIEASFEALPGLLHPDELDRPVKLFDLPTMPAQAAASNDEERRDASESLAFTSKNVAIIDKLKNDLNARSRNDLLVTAVSFWVRDEDAAEE
ncbi:hypothetical protein [Arthrobacter woluwensis]|uniref:hypothetical protein n=1 Tax=Arthrobacter woluwensis TaxID=156980 RepID=UPI00380ED5AB